MKTSPIASPVKAGAALAFIITALIGWKLGDAQAKAPAAEAAAPDRADRPVRRMRGATGPSDVAAQRMAAIRAGRDEGERMRATIALAHSLPPSEFAAWMDGRWFSVREGAGVTLFNKIIQERWKTEDPEGLLLWSMKNESGDASRILASWAASDPQRVFAFFKEYPNNQIELRALVSLAKKSPDLALQRLQELGENGISQNDLHYSEQLLVELAKQSPAALEAALDSLPANLRTHAETSIIGEKMKTAFGEEILKLYDRPDGIKILQRILNQRSRDELQAKIFDELESLPASWYHAIGDNAYSFVGEGSAAKWVNEDLEGLGFTTEQARNIRITAISQMFYKQPQEALKLLNDTDLPPENRKNLISNLFQHVRDNPEQAEAMLAMLDSEEEREIARAVSARNEGSSGEIKIEEPADWLEKVAALDSKTEDSYQYMRMLRNWDADKLAALARTFDSMPAGEKLAIAQIVTSQSYSEASPLEAGAIRYLVENPADPPGSELQNPKIAESNRIQLASRYVGKMAQNDPGAASEWIQTLPSGDAKLWAQKNLHAIWSTYDPQAADQYLHSLPKNVQAQVKELKP